MKIFRSSLIVLLGSLGGSFLNYLFQLAMGRLLSPSEYGVLISLFSLLYIIGVPGGVLGTTATKFASKYKARGDFEAVTASLVWMGKLTTALGFSLFGLSFLFRSRVAEFLKIANPLLPALFFVFIVFSFLSSAPLGVLQGLQRFKAFSFVSFLGPLLKFLLGVGLAILGFGVLGVVWGLIISSGLVLTISVLLLKKNLRFPFSSSSFAGTDLLRYSLPTAIILLALTSLYNIDIILVKHFFSPKEAGIYSLVATLGRIIFFGLGAVTTVMFPLASEKYESRGNPFGVFKNAIWLVSVGAALGVLLYFLFPRLLVNVLFGPRYLSAVPYLGIFALFMALYSLVNLISQFFLAVRKFYPAAILAVFAILQIILLLFFHHTLLEVVYVNIGITVGILTAYAFYYCPGLQRGKDLGDNHSGPAGFFGWERLGF